MFRLSSLIFWSLEGRGLRGVGPKIGKSRGEFFSVGWNFSARVPNTVGRPVPIFPPGVCPLPGGTSVDSSLAFDRASRAISVLPSFLLCLCGLCCPSARFSWPGPLLTDGRLKFVGWPADLEPLERDERNRNRVSLGVGRLSLLGRLTHPADCVGELPGWFFQ